MWRAFLVSGRFLTRLPWPDPGAVEDADAGRAALFYPFIGLLIGAALWALAASLGEAPTTVAAVLVVVLWTWLTGALHLDGVSDSTDGWVGGLGSRERTLEIMRDPRAGAMGVVAVVLLLLAKWTAVAALLTAGQAAALIWVPMLARAQLLVLFLTTPYARSSGLASAALAHLPRAAAWLIAVASFLAVAWLLGGDAAWVLVAVMVVASLWRRMWMNRIRGFTGDTAGALVELSETTALFVLVLAAE